jgi:hypothetical protein
VQERARDDILQLGGAKRVVFLAWSRRRWAHRHEALVQEAILAVLRVAPPKPLGMAKVDDGVIEEGFR